jgi:hypothetical protein
VSAKLTGDEKGERGPGKMHNSRPATLKPWSKQKSVHIACDISSEKRRAFDNLREKTLSMAQKPVDIKP